MILSPIKALSIQRAARLISTHAQTVLFVTSLLRAREIKMATALRRAGWKVVLIYLQTTPFRPEDHFDVAIQARSDTQAHEIAQAIWPRITHVFSGAVDELLLLFCREKPGPVVIDLNDVFCETLFDYCHERFEPTRECLEKATGLCARDLQAKFAQRREGFGLPHYRLLFPEYSWLDEPGARGATPKRSADEVHVVSVGTITLEAHGMYDSAYLEIACRFAAQKIHLHIYPHWFYRRRRGSSFNWDLQKDFEDFIRLGDETGYVHVHPSLPVEKLADELPQYDFGIVAGGSPRLGQELKLLKPHYMAACYSGRIADYLDARLPVLINPEVGFNTWLLKRYGLAIDLDGLLEPGFRDRLLKIKRDPARRAAVEAAARTHSIDRNIGRLTAFYERIIEETPWETPVRGMWWPIALSIPVVGRPVSLLHSHIHKLNEKVFTLKEALNDERKEAVYRRKLVEEMRRRVASPVTAAIESDELRLGIEFGSNWVNDVSGLLNWPDAMDAAQRATGMVELMQMLVMSRAAEREGDPFSSCWNVLNYKHLHQLLTNGYRNFKRTLGTNYFNFLVQAGDPQIAFLEAELGETECARCRTVAATLADDPAFEWPDQRAYRYFVLLLWRYAQKIDEIGYLKQLEEPEEGNPLVVDCDGARASQDLANSLIEYYSMREGVDFAQCRRVLEIGGGYGRDAFVILSLNPHLQYTMVDIPPALWVAQRYLSTVLPRRAIFRAQDFKSFREVRDDMGQASIVFLLPHQLKLIPNDWFDLSINISSFGEMRSEQISNYFTQLERLTRRWFYMKQWKVSQNAFDKLKLTETDYPVPEHWEKFYSRTCRVQTAFFEALYDLRKGSA